MSLRIAREWASEEFGHAELGDVRRVMRLVRMAAAAANSGKVGTVPVVFGSEEADGAYDFLENHHVRPEQIAHAAAVAAARRCEGYPFAFCLMDGTSISLPDSTGRKELGLVGTGAQGGRGVKAISALILSPDGVPEGIGVFSYWMRPLEPNKGPNGKGKLPNGKRKIEDKETQHWLDVAANTRQVFADEAPSVPLWFVIDREGDSWTLLHESCRDGSYMTVRNRVNRKLVQDIPGQPMHLRDRLAKEEATEEFELNLPRRPSHPKRIARMQVKSCKVTLDMRENWNKQKHPLTLNAVGVHEIGGGDKPLDWVLLTNHPVDTPEDRMLVIFSYMQRWHIEEFHRTWKSSACKVEQTQLRHPDNIIRWATILASVAARTERLKFLSRTEPDLPATTEFSAAEISAVRFLKKRASKTPLRLPKTPTISQIVTWIAEIGGYTGPSSGGPPGTITIVRGLERLRYVILGLEFAKAHGTTDNNHRTILK